MKKMFLVTGFPRSGTHFTKTLLRNYGLKAAGEEYGRLKPLSHEKKADCVVSWQHLDLHQEHFPVILHQVRHPLKVISSAQTLYNNSLRKIFKKINAPNYWSFQLHFRKTRFFNDDIIIHRLMYSWLYWNEQIERDPRNELVFRLENIENSWSDILDKIGAENSDMPALRKNVNTRKGKYDTLTWEKLHEVDDNLANKIILKAKEYGYEK